MFDAFSVHFSRHIQNFSGQRAYSRIPLGGTRFSPVTLKIRSAGPKNWRYFIYHAKVEFKSNLYIQIK